MQNKTPLLISVAEAAKVLGVSRPTAYRLAKNGGLPLVGLGGRHRVPVAELERMVGQKISPERLAEATVAA